MASYYLVTGTSLGTAITWPSGFTYASNSPRLIVDTDKWLAIGELSGNVAMYYYTAPTTYTKVFDESISTSDLAATWFVADGNAATTRRRFFLRAGTTFYDCLLDVDTPIVTYSEISGLSDLSNLDYFRMARWREL